MIKLQEAVLKEDEEGRSEESLQQALEIMKKLYDKTTNAFSEFKAEDEFKGEPHVGEYVDHKGNFISDICKRIYIADLIFEFKIKVSDSFNRNNLVPKVSFVHRGSTSTEVQFTIEHAQELLKATEIATKLAEEAKKELANIK